MGLSSTVNEGTRSIEVSLTVTNTGSVAGAEVPQVYLGIPSRDQPPKRLMGFTKVFLEPAASQRVTITIDPAATNQPLSVWDHCTNDFVVPAGDHTVFVGTAIDNTPHTVSVSVG